MFMLPLEKDYLAFQTTQVHLDGNIQGFILYFQSLYPLCIWSMSIYKRCFHPISISSCREVSRGINIWGLVSVILFYLLILLIGVYAAWKNKSLKSGKTEDIMLANRNIGMALGVFTMTGIA